MDNSILLAKFIGISDRNLSGILSWTGFNVLSSKELRFLATEMTGQNGHFCYAFGFAGFRYIFIGAQISRGIALSKARIFLIY
jgi:hypothetical protein